MLNVKNRFVALRFGFLVGVLVLSGCSSQLKYEPRAERASQTVSPSQTIHKDATVCRSPYVVKPGDTLSEIAYDCGVDMSALAMRNGLLPPYIIYVNQELSLPLPSGASQQVASKPRSSKPSRKSKPTTSSPQRTQSSATAIEKSSVRKSNKTTSSSAWQWPVNKGLEYRYRRDHAGLSVLEVYGVPGQEIYAVAPGKVVYAGNGILNYGWMVVIKHDNDYMSIYAHNSALLVSEGQQVEAGQQVALLGATGDTNRPKLYLEARYQGRKTDIKKVLPD